MDVVKDWESVQQRDYHPLGGTEEYWASGQGWADLLSTFLPENARVLDFGCGDGRVAKSLVGRFRVSGYDTSLETLVKFAKNVPEARIYYSLDHEPEFDCVLCLAVLIHYPADEGRELIARLGKVTSDYLVLNIYDGKKREPRAFCDVGIWDPSELAEAFCEAGLNPIDHKEACFILRKAV